MSSDDNLALSEIEVIKSIYFDAIEEISRENENAESEFIITILPQHGSSCGPGVRNENTQSWIKLKITIPATYPDMIPKFIIQESKGLSNAEKEELVEELIKLAKNKIGEEMIFDLVQCSESFLYSHQKLPALSFYDQMLDIQQKKMEHSKLVEIERREKEKMALKEEYNRRQEQLKKEIRLIKEEMKAQQEEKLLEDQPSTESGGGDVLTPENQTARSAKSKIRRSRSTSEGSDDSSSTDSTSITILELMCGKNSRTVHQGEVLGKSKRGSTVYAGLEWKTGSLVALSEYKFSFKVDKKGREVKNEPTCDGIIKQVNSFETEFNALQKLDHPGIVRYLGFKVVSDIPGRVYIYIAEEFVRGSTLKSYLQGTLCPDFAFIRHCTQGLVEALTYLHSNNIVHRFLRETSIFINSLGNVKVTDYGLERKITELYQSTIDKNEVVEDKLAPSIGRGAKKCDIYRLGILVLSLIKGQYIMQNPPEIPTKLPMELQDFLNRCLTTDEHARWAADKLLDHKFFKIAINDGPNMRFVQDKEEDPVKNEIDADTSAELIMDSSLTFNALKGQRLQNEFQVLKWLGKGGFGDVLKVKNKLDSRIYALKRIRLNPKNIQLNKKITREVKLLSQLNHENVVRYFNSWIETQLETEADDSSESTTNFTPTTADTKSVHFNPKPNLRVMNKNSLGFVDNIEELAPQSNIIKMDSEWGTSAGNDFNDAGSESSDSSDEDLFGASFLNLVDDESQDVIFEGGSASSSITKSSRKGSDNNDVPDETSVPILTKEIQYLYIQMEFCEKSTLRTAIDGDLYQESERAWRLFREIVEGLVHIHQQGMIHRDLKPVNIFLDSEDHVKIGDFGLATTSILPRNVSGAINNEEILLMQEKVESMKSKDTHSTDDLADESLTSAVGTALYVAPELMSRAGGGKALYNQKVDIYSLGIIFFEMFYRPLGTSMERVRTIQALRQKQIQLPPGLDAMIMPQQVYIIKWLLSHDPQKRPTSLELLQSDYLPPPQLQERELQDMFRQTLSNSHSKAYKYLVSSCFKQKVTAVENVTFDLDNSKLVLHTYQHLKTLQLTHKVRNVIQSIFERHGGIEVLSIPTLLPKSNIYDKVDTSVQVMCHSGNVCQLPHDLRIPFARYVSRYGISRLKRYSITKVFRERKVHGLHPKELMECSFDIIDSSQGNFIGDAEVASIVLEIVNELPWTRGRKCTIRVSHTDLLDGMLLHHGIDKQREEIKRILVDMKSEKSTKYQIQTRLCSLCLPDSFIAMLFSLIETEGQVSKVSNILRSITRRKNEAGNKITGALHQIEILMGHIEAFGLKCDVVVSPTMLFGSNIFSGLIFQVVCNLKRRSRPTLDVVAAGGRYDSLISTFRSEMEMATESRDIIQCGVGVSISMDKLVAAFDAEDDAYFSWRKMTDVIIFSMESSMVKEKIDLMKDFWNFGIHVAVLDGAHTLEAADEYCREIQASVLVILKDDYILGHSTSTLRVRYWERDSFQERKMTKMELIDFIMKYHRRSSYESTSDTRTSLLKTDSANVKSSSSQLGDSISTTAIGNNPSFTSGSLSNVNISFVIPDKDKIAGWKRRYENQMLLRVSDILPKLAKHTIELVGIEFTNLIINTLASCLQMNDKDEFRKSITEVIERHPQKKKYLKSVCDEIYDLSFEKCAPVIIIYGLVDNSFRVLL